MPQQHHRIAVFGGTFDPPHNGHFVLAEKVLEENYADEILFIPALQPPHKPGCPSAEFNDRCSMLKLAVGELNKINSNYSVSDIEGNRTGVPSYTYDTMTQLAELYSDSELFFLIGADSLLNIHTWYKAEELINKWKILTYPRGVTAHGSQAVLNELKEKWTESIAYLLFESILPFETYNISSTEIRKKIANDEKVSDLLNPNIYKFIKEKGLYQSG